jgi:menaquinone-dependent protoporphyrinogen IX oxidase
MKKVLVAYSTWTSATRSVAEEIGKTFAVNDIEPVVSIDSDVESLAGYDFIVLGTSIHASRIARGFRKLLKNFHKELANRPTAFFVVCANMIEDNEENRAESLGWLEKTTGKYPDINPVSIGLFSGAVINDSREYNQLFFVLRKIIDAMKEKMIEEYGKSDFRDWNKIRIWTQEIVDSIQ